MRSQSDDLRLAGKDRFVHSRFGRAVAFGELPKVVLLTPEREGALALAARCGPSREMADHYDFLLLRVETDAGPLAVCSVGHSSASVAVAVEELADLGAEVLIGVGRCRPVPETAAGIVIATGVMRIDGASPGYAHLGFPAATSYEVGLAALRAARDLGITARSQVVCDSEGLLDREVSSSDRVTPERRAELVEQLTALRVANCWTGAATILVQSAIYGLRAGCISANMAAPSGAQDGQALRDLERLALATAVPFVRAD